MEIQISRPFLCVSQVFTGTSTVLYVSRNVNRKWEYGDMKQAHLGTLQPGSITNEGARYEGGATTTEPAP